jgi:C4-dicarboxylate transporter, DctM subunit
MSGVLTTILALALLGSGAWLWVGIILATAATLVLLLGFPIDRVGAVLRAVTWKTVTSWELIAVPLFIWIGEIVFRTDISLRLFRGLLPFVSRIPGGLLHSNVLGSALFAAVCGSSVATTATVGKITVRELLQRGYDRTISVGSLAGAGSLGLLIPPSIVLLVYGLVAEISVLKLFAAGVIPGILMGAAFMAYIVYRCLRNPSLVPPSRDTFTARDRLRALWDLSPVLMLILFVFAALYSGIATASEAAVVGVLAAFAITLLTGQFSFALVRESGLAAIMTSTMIITLVIGSNFMSTAMAYLHLPQELATWIQQLQLSPFALIMLLVVVYVILGGPLDGLSMIVMTTPIVLPIVVSAGYDPIWFGVFLVIMSELAVISPPIGFNLFILQGLAGMSNGEVTRAAMPFFCIMLLACLVLILFPAIATWLPRLLYGG